MATAADVNKCIKQCLRMKGLDPETECEYSEATCCHCYKSLPSDGQKALRVLATERGIYFQLQRPCECGYLMGFIEVMVAPVVQEKKA